MSRRFDPVHSHVEQAALCLKHGHRLGRPDEQSARYAILHLRTALRFANSACHPDKGRVFSALNRLRAYQKRMERDAAEGLAA